MSGCAGWGVAATAASDACLSSAAVNSAAVKTRNAGRVGCVAIAYFYSISYLYARRNTVEGAKMPDVTLMKPSSIQLDVEQADKMLRDLAAEVACDSFEIGDILKARDLTLVEFKEIERQPRFQMYLREAISSWSSTANTQERVRAKAALAVETVLPDLVARITDTREPLSAKTELFKALLKAGAIGEKEKSDGVAGEKVSIVINLGENSVRLQKTIQGLPTQVINAEAL